MTLLHDEHEGEPRVTPRDRPESTGSRRLASVSPWIIGVGSLAFGILLVLRVLLAHQLNPTIFVAFGEDSKIQTTYGQQLLGEVVLRQGLGHDGKFFFAQANDPWYLDPFANAAVLDRPIYRAERMLYPMLAGGFGLFPPHVVVWAMVITNLVALALGAVLAAKLAAAWGAPAWLGFWVPFNVGLLFELDIGGSGIVAYTCCLGALYALVKDRIWLASALFAAGALSRETMLLVPAGVFILLWLDHRRLVWPILVTPLAALAVWTTYLVLRLSDVPGIGGGTDNFGPPFLGLVQAFISWLHDPLDLVVSVVLLGVVVAFVPLAVRSRLSIAWGALPFVPLAIVLSANVLDEPSNLSRALSPIFTALPFLILVPGWSASAPTDQPVEEAT